MQSPSEPIMQLQNSSRFSRVCPLNHLVNLALWLCAHTTGQTTVHKTSQNTLHRAIVHINSKWPNVGNDVDIFFCSISSFFLFDFFSKMPLSARKKRESKDKKRKQTIGWVWLFQKRKQFCVLLPCFFYKCAFLLLSEIKKETVYKHHLMLVKSCVYQTSIEQEITRVTHFYGFCLLSLTQFFGGSADIWIIRRNDWRHSQSCVLVIERVRERAKEIERSRKCSIIHDNAAIALGRQMLNALITLESLKDFD